ncbi:MAG: polyphosphate kinase 1 [Verrucomicrobiota bacterium]|jgi:polyphosphate kinase
MKSAAQERYLNRELSWLEFNQRVLEEAMDAENPLLERLKFLGIASSNLDEFFEVRVAGLKQEIEQQAQSRQPERGPDGRTPAEVFRAVRRRVLLLVDGLYRCWRQGIQPALAAHGIRVVRPAELEPADLAWLEQFYRAEVRPTITPIAIDQAHPFPQLLNKSLNLMVRVELAENGVVRRRLAVVQVPRNLPTLVKLPREDGRQDFVLLGETIGHFLADLFPGTLIRGYWSFRLTRNGELYIDEEETSNLLMAVEAELHNRRRGDAVRLEVRQDCPADISAELLTTLRLTKDDLYHLDGPLNLTRLTAICEGDHSAELRDPPFLPPVAPSLRDAPDLFAVIRQRDVLLHHPYESFESVVQFLQQASADPRVLAIKQTLYRTGGDARIIGALMDAVKNGKQVTAVVELRARFDEANNIAWSRRLEEAGVHVVYGLVGYKIHSKITLVVRRDPDGIRRYLHVATGNYNPTTAKLYTDLGLFTCRPDYGADATNLFNLLTGVCQFPGTAKLMVAPFDLHRRLLELIAREAANGRRGLPARIIAKMNSLVDTAVIDALYAASQAGVQIDLIVRGICCLRPQVKGLSDHITVRSIVGRFLEHGRIYYFENACQPEVLVGSADWMPRNFFKRMEVVFPVEDGNLRDRIINEILAHQLADNVKARIIQPDGTHVRAPRPAGAAPHNSQAEFMALARRTAGNQPAPHPTGQWPRVQVATAPPGPRVP